MAKIFGGITWKSIFLMLLIASSFTLLSCSDEDGIGQIGQDSKDGKETTVRAASVKNGVVQIDFTLKDSLNDNVNISPYGPLTPADITFFAAQLDDTGNWRQVLNENMGVGTFNANADGTYTYKSFQKLEYTQENLDALNKKLGTATPYAKERETTFDAAKTYRVGITFGGSNAPPGSPTFDFVPDKTTELKTRAIVETDACKACHGQAFAAHGGNRKTVENCVFCHNPTTNDYTYDAVTQKYEIDNNEYNDGKKDSTNLSVMIHNIHNATEDYWVFRSRAGGNWYNWGEYKPANKPRATDTMEFPRKVCYSGPYKDAATDTTFKHTNECKVPECAACHESDTKTMADGLAWQEKPSKAGCGDSCHTDVDFATGTAHKGGPAADDACANCHKEGGASPVSTKHSINNTNVQSAVNKGLDTPQFTVEVSLIDDKGAAVSEKKDITSLSAAPKVKIVIKDAKTGTAITHTDINDATKWPDATATKRGSYVNLYVYGPRSKMKPVLTEAALKANATFTAGNAMRNSTSAAGVVTKAATQATVAADSITYQLNTITTTVIDKVKGTKRYTDAKNTINPILTHGTYIVYVDVLQGGQAIDSVKMTGYQSASVAKVNFQIGNAPVEKRIAGNCETCHGKTKMHQAPPNRHDTYFDPENCGACHDYQQQTIGTHGTTFDWGGAVPIVKRVHAVHASGTLLEDPNTTVEYVLKNGEFWEIVFPAPLNECVICHAPKNSSTAWKDNPNQLACMGCHDNSEASLHMGFMGGEYINDVGDGQAKTCVACHGASGQVSVESVHNRKAYTFPAPTVTYTGKITEAQVFAK